MQENEELKSKITSGFSILLIREITLKILAFIGQLILARILSPSDFGYYVILVFLINFMSLFSDIGLSYAIIQKKETPTDEQINGVFTFKTALNIFLILLIIVFAPFVTYVYPSFQAEHILQLRILSLVLFFSSLRAVPIALMERNIQYSLISIIDMFGIISYYIAAIIFAILGFQIWSFIFATLIKEIVEVILVYILKPWIPKFIWKRNSLADLIRFGMFIQGNGILNFLNTAIIPILAGAKISPYAAGILDWAFNLAYGPDSAITTNFGRVAFSGFSRMQNHRELLVRSIEKSMSILSIFTLLLPVLLLGFGREAVQFLYTQKWLAGVSALYWFTTMSLFSAVMVSLGQGILVLGKSKNIFFVILISNIVNWILSFIFIIHIGYTGIAVSSFFSGFLFFILCLWIAGKSHIHIHFIKILFPKYGVSAITLLGIFFMNTIFPHNLAYLFFKICTALLWYFLFSFIFSRSDIMAIVVVGLTFLGFHNLAEKSKKLKTNILFI